MRKIYYITLGVSLLFLLLLVACDTDSGVEPIEDAEATLPIEGTNIATLAATSPTTLTINISATINAVGTLSPTETVTAAETPESEVEEIEESSEAMIDSLTVNDQSSEADSVVVANVSAAQDGWMVIHADNEGSPGSAIGQTVVEAGETQDVVVEINTAEATDTLYAMLHIDSGEIGTYEFPGPDAPATDADGNVVVQSFSLLNMGGEGQEEENEMINTPVGLADTHTQTAADAAFGELITMLEDAGPIGIVAQIDHATNAESAGLSLPPTAVVLFGNPMLGTPLMQENQLTGLDLPQKMLVFSDDERTHIAYNSTDYLAERHGVGSVETLPQIAQALQNFASTVSGDEVEISAADSVSLNEGITIVDSSLSFDETYANLKSTLEENPNITIVAELNHQANAASVDMELRRRASSSLVIQTSARP